MKFDIDLIIEWLEGEVKSCEETRDTSVDYEDYNFYEGERVAYNNTINLLNTMKAIKGE